MALVGLCPRESGENRVEENLARIREDAVRGKALGLDALFFGEAYLQGFDSLLFCPEEDAKIAFREGHSVLKELGNIAREQAIFLGFGYFELDEDRFYAAYRVVNPLGRVICHYRRRSPGWRYPDAPPCYREGTEFKTFDIRGKTLGLMVCGDFYEPGLQAELQALSGRVDAFLWPVHCDYPLEDWENGILKEYREHSAQLLKPVLFVNNLHPLPERAKGGAYCWYRGRTLFSLPAGREGLLAVEL